VRLAKARGVKLRQSYVRVGKRTLIKYLYPGRVRSVWV
jgi:hypothetical protein